ncbi:MAG: hypothetical protein AABY00_03620 [Nanoarchaeota archaeon]
MNKKRGQLETSGFRKSNPERAQELHHNKQAVLDMSFGMIFSLIIIATTLAIAGYMIVKFMNAGSNVLCGQFKEGLQRSIDDAWRSDGASIDTRREPLPSLPSDVKEICFGNATQSLLALKDKANYEDFKEYALPGRNLYITPRTACKGEFSYTLTHATSQGFFCVPVKKGKASLLIVKENTSALVSLSPL